MFDELVEQVRRQGGDMCFPLAVKAECERRGVPYDGDQIAVFPASNLVTLVAVSGEAVDIAAQLMVEERVTVEATSLFVYFADGAPVPTKMPMAKRKPRNGRYATEHWVPMLVRVQR